MQKSANNEGEKQKVVKTNDCGKKKRINIEKPDEYIHGDSILKAESDNITLP